MTEIFFSRCLCLPNDGIFIIVYYTFIACVFFLFCHGFAIIGSTIFWWIRCGDGYICIIKLVTLVSVLAVVGWLMESIMVPNFEFYGILPAINKREAMYRRKWECRLNYSLMKNVLPYILDINCTTLKQKE